MNKVHIPVLLDEVLAQTKPQNGNFIIDATLGIGGHTKAFLEKIGKTGKLLGLDADERNLKLVRQRFAKFSNIQFIHTNFRYLENFISPSSADIILFDLGVSSAHFDEISRGFSFRGNAPLDSRFDTNQPLTAAAILNGFSENKIAEILRQFGEIGISRKLARKISNARHIKKLRTTNELTALIEPKSLLPQVFQALRIAVNDELNALKDGLRAAVEVLKSGGKVAAISFHSLEDRIIKNFFQQESRECICPPELPKCCCNHAPSLKIITKKPIFPTSTEIQKNPRSRSAKLRVAQKI